RQDHDEDGSLLNLPANLIPPLVAWLQPSGGIISDGLLSTTQGLAEIGSQWPSKGLVGVAVADEDRLVTRKVRMLDSPHAWARVARSPLPPTVGGRSWFAAPPRRMGYSRISLCSRISSQVMGGSNR